MAAARRYRNSSRASERRAARAPGVAGAACYDACDDAPRAALALAAAPARPLHRARDGGARPAIGLLVFTFVLLIDQIPRLLAVLVARSADLAHDPARVPEPAALDPGDHDPDGVPARGAARVRPAGERQRDRRPARGRREPAAAARRPVMMLAAVMTAHHVLHQRGRASRREPGPPRDRVLAGREQGPHRREGRAPSPTSLLPGPDDALRPGHRARHRPAGRTC